MDAAALRAAGWTAMEVGGFTGSVGPFWSRGTGAERSIALVAEARHSNSHLGTVHGGVLMTFADICLGIGVREAIGGPHCVTAQLQIQFVAAARVGELIFGQPEIVRRTSQLVFVRGLIRSGERTVASADGIWKVLETT